ncbi:hypothetical protein N9A86_01380 [Akkermansiaceae bacterium]|nr:hypothetical protein [Akkermansiaceae bacterium]
MRPLARKIPLVRLARWLEERHPEVQERISTALELSDHPEGISPSLLKELSKDAAKDVGSINPTDEVRSERVKKSLWPAAVMALALVSLLAIWPREMGRLLARVVSPFSDLGNIGAFRFTINPGNLEVLEGDEVIIEMTYEGKLDGDLDFVVKKDGETLTESLSPVSSEGDTHQFRYHLPSAENGFFYSARVGRSESDRFEVRVWPIPILQDGVVRYQYPAYTGWPDRSEKLQGGIKALPGTKITVTGTFDSPIKSGQILFKSSELGSVEVENSANGSSITWHQTMAPETFGNASLKVTHKLGRELEGGNFAIESLIDEAPAVRLLSPIQREVKMRPDDQIILKYEVIEKIGLGKAEIQIEAGGKNLEPLQELLPEKKPDLRPNLWSGEAMIYLGSLLPRIDNPGEFKIRLAISDNRPADLEGPGVGYSEWITIKINKNAASLVRQELHEQDSDLKKTLEKAIQDIYKAEAKMHQAKSQLRKEEVPQPALDALNEARDQLADTEKDLAELSERMKESVQAHRRDELEEAIDKIAQSRQEVERTPLQDTDESRKEEIESAIRHAKEAANELKELRNEVDKDHPKIEDLAKLEELAQKQDQLAHEANDAAENAENADTPLDREWQKKQEQIEDQIRDQVRQSPEAKAAALEKQAEKARDLAEQAAELKEAQENLAEMASREKSTAEKIAEALSKAQEKINQDIKEELAVAQGNEEAQGNEASQGNEEAKGNEEAQGNETAQGDEDPQGKDEARAENLSEALAKGEEALKEANSEEFQEAAEAAQNAAKELAQGAEESRAQQGIQERQEKVAEAFEALAEGNTGEAMEALEEMQQDALSDALADALAQEQEAIVEDIKEELGEARANSEPRANDLPEAMAQAEAALESAQANDPGEAAEAAQQAAAELAKGAEESASQSEVQERQEQVAEALEALAEGNTAEALAALEEMQAERAAELSDEVNDFAQADSDQMANARGQTEQASIHANQAAKANEAGKSQQASDQNQQASERFAQAESALNQAAENFAEQAAQAAQQELSDRKAPTPGQPLAEAFQQSAEAAQASSAQEASKSAQAAAQALAQAAQQARSAMSQNGQPGQPMDGQAQNQQGKGKGKPGEGEGDEPQEGARQAQGDKGIPPHLAKLGITSKDWEKIRATLKTDVSGSAGEVVPEDYRGLVKQYFEQVSKEK